MAIYINYRCPKCGGTELRVETPVCLTLKQDGTLELESFEAIPSVDEIVEEPTVLCQNDECEHIAGLHEFDVADRAEGPPYDAATATGMYDHW